MNLLHLPDVPLRIIVSFLPIDDRIRFTQLHPAWHHLQPTVQRVAGPDFDERGPRGGHFVPETYFDVKVESAGVVAVKMEWRWKDQGFGNRKGQVWLKLVRDEQEIADARYTSGLHLSSPFCSAAHFYQRLQFNCKIAKCINIFIILSRAKVWQQTF